MDGGAVGGELTGGEVKEQVDHGQAEERDMAEAVESAAVAGVAAEPVFLVELEAQEEAGSKAEEDPDPGQEEVEVQDGCVHGAEPIELAGGVPIDKLELPIG